MRKNELYEVLCTGYASDGEGVCRVDGQVVFVKGLLEGERAQIRIFKVGKSVSYAGIETLLESSPHRTAPDCPVYGKCGGCALRHMDYAEERRFKEQKVNDALRRIGGLDLAVSEFLAAEETEAYRNKTIYTVGRQNGRTVTGFYRVRSHDLVSAPDCRLESAYARAAAKVLREVMDRYGIPVFEEAPEGVRRLFCRTGFRTGEGQSVLVTGPGTVPHLRELAEALRRVPGTVSVLRNVNGDPGDTVLGQTFETLWGRETVEDELCGLWFRLAADSFYQVNPRMAERLYGKAVELAGLTGEENVLDLYCGAGTITQCMARQAKRAVGIELVESAVASARLTAAANGLSNVDFLCADAAQGTERLLREGFCPDVVVVDPPRKGLSPETPELVGALSPKRIVYVSCDPATLARDLRSFTALGFEAHLAVAADMFPGTSHVETIAGLQRRDM